MKELYSTPEFTVIRFATEDNITSSKDYESNVDDFLKGNANS